MNKRFSAPVRIRLAAFFVLSIFLAACGATDTSRLEALAGGTGTFRYVVSVSVQGTYNPVRGAKVFNSANNSLLATTDSAGYAYLTVKEGQKLRVVEPDYGQQQATVTASQTHQYKPRVGYTSNMHLLWRVH